MLYKEKKARKKAYEAGYKVSKGFQHYNNGAVCRDCNGEAYTGYMVLDLTTNTYVWDCYNEHFDNLWTLEDVEDFIKGKYEEAGIKY